MTEQEAVDLTLEKFNYYLEHPSAFCVADLPTDLFNRVKDLKNFCSMCELFYCKGCPDCPLRSKSGWPCTKTDRKSLLNNIAKIQAWVIDRRTYE